MPGTPETVLRAAARNPDIVLAFDFGLRRIGVAAGNLLTRTASPHTPLAAAGGLPPWNDIDALIANFAPGTVVVGLPGSVVAGTTETADSGRAGSGTRMPTQPSAIEGHIRSFVAALEKRYGLPVATVDESLTSREAEAEIREARRSGALSRRAGKGGIDRRAACLIAEQWMSGQPRSSTSR
jgi:putative Holliday junction resolvase